MKRFRTRYGGSCESCGDTVRSNQTCWAEKRGSRWALWHETCHSATPLDGLEAHHRRAEQFRALGRPP